MSPKKGPFQKERIVFQPPIIKGHLGFQGCNLLVVGCTQKTPHPWAGSEVGGFEPPYEKWGGGSFV